MRKPIIILIDLILLVGTIGAVIALFMVGFGDGGISLSPSEGLDRSAVLFQFEGVNRIIVDDSVNLDSPDRRVYEVVSGEVIVLSEGVHYLGLESAESIEIRKFELDSSASFVLVELSEGSYGLANQGSDLNVVVRQGGQERNLLFEGGKDA